MKIIWEHIFNGDRDIMKRMDYDSTQILELTCPKMSASDARTISQTPIGRHLSKEEQYMIRNRSLEIDTLIPTFRSLFKDLNYLEDLVNAIKQLHRPGRKKRSLRKEMRCIHKDSRNADTAWKELFLYTMRNYYRIRAPPIRDLVLKASDPISLEGHISEADEAQLRHFAKYAFDLGFRNCERWTRQPLLAEWTDGEGKYDAEEKHNPMLVTLGRDVGVLKDKRSGRPQKEVHHVFSKFLWIRNMEATNEGIGEGITDFFVRKAKYRAFFDPLKPLCAGTTPNTRLSSFPWPGMFYHEVAYSLRTDVCLR